MRRFGRPRGMLDVSGLALLVTPLAAWFMTSVHVPGSRCGLAVAPGSDSAEPRHLAAMPPVSIEQLLSSDPMAVVRKGRERYERDIRDWRAILSKQELLPDGLSPVQEIEVRYRNDPRAVYMIWKANAGAARRALYMPGDPRFVDRLGRARARVEPNGVLARLITTDVYVPVHGPDARRTSRRTIDECGFASTFASLEKFNGIAETRGVLDFRYEGAGEIDGRKTFRIVRNLPYNGPDGPFLDARMILHLDQEWLLPVAVYSYADRGERQLLGVYVFTKIELNPGLDETSFAFGP